MRKPDLVIGPADNPYMLRWHLLRLFGWQLALHKICRSDDDRALHDHRANNISLILRGQYYEWLSHKWEPARGFWRRPWHLYCRRAETPHRLWLTPGTVVWSLWLRGPPRRNWGFWCSPTRWVPWEQFVAEKEHYNVTGSSTVGRGCD